MPDMIYQGNINRLLILPALAAACLAGCGGPATLRDEPAAETSPSGTASPDLRTSDSSQPARQRAARIAGEQVGIRYRYGGATRDGFDCSGLVYYSYGQSGVTVPRTTQGLWSRLAPVDRHELTPGDVLFFNIKGKMAHVGVYLGGTQFVHAPASGGYVSVESLNSEFYRDAYLRAGRVR